MFSRRKDRKRNCSPKQYESSSDESWTQTSESSESSEEQSDYEESDEEVVRPQPKYKYKRVRRIKSSEEEDNNTNDNLKNAINLNEIESDSDLEIVGVYPPGKTTIVRNEYKFKDSSGSDTYSDRNSDGLEDIKSDSDIDTITPIDKDVVPIESLVTISSESVCDSTLNGDTPVTKVCTSPSVSSSISPFISPPLSPTISPTLPNMTNSSVRPPEPQLPTSCMPIMIVKTPNKMPYEVTIWKNGQAIKVPPPPNLPQTLVFRIIDAKETLKEINKRLNNSCDEIEAIDQTLRISLFCPITNLRVKIPSRSVYCHHFDCFDINSFLEINYNKKIDDWKCPKCKQPAKTGQLIIDSLLMHILNHESVDSSVESVIFDNKAVWVPDIKLSEIHANQNSDANVINILDAIGEEIIELDDDDDDDDDEDWTALKKSASNPNTANQGLKKVSETIATAKSIEQNISNLIHTNRNQSNQRGGNSEEPNYDRILLFLKSAEQEIEPRPRLSRWSNNPTPQQTRNPTVVTPVPLANAFRQAFNSGQVNTHRSTAQQPQQNRKQMQTNQPPSRAPVVPPRVPPVSVSSVPNPSTNSVTQNSNDCNFKFVFGSDNTLTVFCPSCNESFPHEMAEQHKSSAKHKAKTQTSNTSNTTNANTTNRTEAYRNSVQPVRHNNYPPNLRSIQPVHSTRPPIRTYSNFNYASDAYNNWGRYPAQQQQQMYSTNYQYAYPPPSITNNFYAQTPTYIQQVAPPAHQATPQTQTNAYPNPTYQTNQTNTYPANHTQSNGYYNF